MDKPASFADTVNDVITSQIGRTVTFIVTPILLPLVGALAFWLQNKTGINMDPAEATGYLTAVVVGAAALLYKWLHNRGKYEQIVLELHKLYEAGAELAGQDQPSPAPKTISQ